MTIFGDKRLDARYQKVKQSMIEKQSIILRQLASDRNEEVALGRFLRNKAVKPELMIEEACQKTSEISEGLDVLLIEDTSTLGFGLNTRIEGLSETGDGKGKGFYLHPVLSVDANSGHLLGLASAKQYDRKARIVDVAQRRRDRCREKLGQKESYRWYEEISNSLVHGKKANSYTVVADREADIYELLVLLTCLGMDFVIRSSHNRAVNYPEKNTLVKMLSKQEVQGTYSQALPATDKRSAHTAYLQVKWVEIEISRPRAGTGTKHLPKQQRVIVIDVEEKAESVVGKEQPIHWRLLTSHEVLKLDDALKIIRYYIQRWIIEQFFRTLKKKGLDIQSAQVESVGAAKNLTALSLLSAVKTMQLVQARNEDEGLKMGDVFDPNTIEVIRKINPALEGKTEKLKNHHPPDSLAFASWVVARLGGWSGYESQRPPGPITMWNGLKRLTNAVWTLQLISRNSKLE